MLAWGPGPMFMGACSGIRGKYGDIGGYRAHRLLGFEVLLAVRGSRVLWVCVARVFLCRGLHGLRPLSFVCLGCLGFKLFGVRGL